MSDEDEIESEEEEESDEESGSDSEKDDESVSEAKNKQTLVLDDISTIKDIFSYIDQASKRLVNKFDVQRELKRISAEKITTPDKSSSQDTKREIKTKSEYEQPKQIFDGLDSPDESWNQYEKRLINKFEPKRDSCYKDQRKQNIDDLESLHLSQYENLDDAQRSQLLGKAISDLGKDITVRR